MKTSPTGVSATAYDQLPSSEAELIVPLHVEEATVARRKVTTSVVRVATITTTRDQLIDEPVTHERVEVERVPIGQYVDAVPPVREEGDLTVMPVVEEVIVVERRLLLREEVHIRRVRTTERHVETVQLREQEAVITRHPASERADTQHPSLPGQTRETRG